MRKKKSYKVYFNPKKKVKDKTKTLQQKTFFFKKNITTKKIKTQ